MKACPHPDMLTVSRSRKVVSFATHAHILESFARIWLKYSDVLGSKVDRRSTRRSGGSRGSQGVHLMKMHGNV